MSDSSDKLHPSICHIEGAPPGGGGGGGRGGLDGEDLPSSRLLAVSLCGCHVVCSLLPGAQQPVVYQPLPGATEVWAVVLRGRSTGAPPNCMAGGKDGDSVISEQSTQQLCTLAELLFLLGDAGPALTPIQPIESRDAVDEEECQAGPR